MGLTLLYSLARRISTAVPWWMWLVLVVASWGAWQRHSATAAADTLRRAEVAAQVARAQAAEAAASESMRRVAAQQEVIRDADIRSQTLARDAAAARAVAGSVRAAAAAAVASAAARSASAAGSRQAASEAIDLLTVLLGRAAHRAAELADLADRSRAAGEACERSYDSLTAPR